VAIEDLDGRQNAAAQKPAVHQVIRVRMRSFCATWIVRARDPDGLNLAPLSRTMVAHALPFPSDSVSRISTQIAAIPRLEREEELRLARRAQRGDTAARDRIVTAHLRLVLWVALKHRRYGFPIEDLMGEGTLGMLEALDRFDPGRGLRFNTYAVHWIRAYIVRYILRNWRVVRVGSSPRHSLAFFRLHRERARLQAQLGDATAVDAELARKVGAKPDRLRSLEQRWTVHDVSLDEPARGRGRDNVGDRLRSDADPEASFGELEEQALDRSRVRRALLDLDARESTIVQRRLMAEDPVALRHVGQELGLSRERVRQLEQRARRKLLLALA
jgi:RNA polymerase sigma-32 factor